MVVLGEIVLPVALPFLVVVPAYILGRRLFFKGVPQAEMHTFKKGKLFTLMVGLLYLALMAVLYVVFFF